MNFNFHYYCIVLNCWINACVRACENLENDAKIGCALIGSLGASYNGLSLINLAIALFALVAIESSSQSLGRTYAFLLFCAILLDISWFILFSNEIWCVQQFLSFLSFLFDIIYCNLLFMYRYGLCCWDQVIEFSLACVMILAPKEGELTMTLSFLYYYVT